MSDGFRNDLGVSCYTGLCISDVAMSNVGRLNGNECYLFMHKTGRACSPQILLH